MTQKTVMTVAAETPSLMTRSGELQKIEALLGGVRVLSNCCSSACRPRQSTLDDMSRTALLLKPLGPEELKTALTSVE
jgi:hypothetical protein